jgi:hypothetical protein
MGMNWDFGVGDILQGVGMVSDFFGESEKEKDRARVGEQQQRDSAKEREQIRSFAQDYETDFVSAAGGQAFQPGGQSAAKARAKMAETDYENAQRLAGLQKEGPLYQLTLPQARAGTAENIARHRQTVVDPALTNFAKQANRRGGADLNNPALLGQYADNLRQLQEGLRRDEFTEGLDLFNRQRGIDQDFFSTRLAQLAPQVSNVPYMANPLSTGQGAGIAGLAQSPIPAPVASVSPTAQFSGVLSGGIADATQRYQTNQDRQLLAELIRQIGDQPATTVNPTTSADMSRSKFII